MNKENHKLQAIVDQFTGGKTTVNEIESMQAEIKELAFQNSNLRKDMRESVKIIKDY